MRTRSILVLISILISCAIKLYSEASDESLIMTEQNTESSNAVISNEYFNLNSEKGFDLKVSEMEGIPYGFVHRGKISPEGQVQILTEELDHGYQSLSFRTYHATHKVDEVHFSPRSYTWSPSGKYVVIHNIDYYADAGSTGIVILNVQSGHYMEITREQIINGKDLGKREKLNIYNIVWLDSERFSMVASAGYLGESGHPGINYNRKSELGDKLGNKDDIVLVANWEIEIVKDESERLDPERVEKSETMQLLWGKWQSMDDRDSYIMFTDEEVIFSYGIEIISREPYVLSDSCMSSDQSNVNLSSDEQKYIHMRESDTCFYIIELGTHYLSLSYVGRGNTLEYVK